MAAGHFVFPTIIVVFILVFASLVVSTPATPPSENPAARAQKVRIGDEVLLEFTGFYDGDKVFFSTQEERKDLKVGPITPIYEESPINYTTQLLTSGKPEAITSILIGHRVGDVIHSDPIPASVAFGDWQGNRNVNRTLAPLLLQIRYTADSILTNGRPFDADEYAASWAQQGTDLRVGLVFKCEHPDLWSCEVTEFDRERDVFAYKRVVRAGDTFPFRALLGGIQAGGDLAWSMTALVDPNGQNFRLRLDPPVGSRLQFRTTLRGPFEAGTYEVTSLTDTHIIAKFSTATPSEPGLVGKAITYDLVIVRITRR